MKSFLTACGLADSLQLVVESQKTAEGELRLLHQPFALIGRDPRADVVLDHTRVSRRHVYLQVVHGRPFWVDLESRTGTHSDGDVQKAGWFDDRRPLCVGPFVIRRFVGDSQISHTLRLGEPPLTAPLVATAYDHAPLPEVVLEFLNGPSRAMTWPVRRVMSLIGSASGCKFRLTDASVSRFHGSLLRTSVGLWIVDLLGQGGITVNEVPIRFSHLVDGDLLRIGRYQIRVRYRDGARATGNELSDHTRAKPLALPHHEKTPNGLRFPDWTTAIPSFAPETATAYGTQFPLAIQAVSSLARFEATALEAARPINLASSDVTESMLVPLVNQFGLMQQQMFDQFQQAMAMMVQMFGTMHRDQMAVIREELDRLNDLTEEIRALKDELANRTHERDETVSGGLSVGSADLAQSAATEPEVSVRVMASDPSRVMELAQEDGDATLADLPPASKSSASKQQISPGPQSCSPSASLNPPTTHSPAEELGEAGLRSQTNNNGTSVRADSEQNSIVWLHQRMITLQSERETRWQKILKLLPGAT